MRTFLVLMTVLCLSAAVQATHHHVPIANLPAPWQGECIVYTRADNDFFRTMGLPLTTHHSCTLITHGVKTKLELTLTLPMRGLFRSTTLTIHPSHTTAETALTFSFPNGTIVTLPKESWVGGLYVPASGWQGRDV